MCIRDSPIPYLKDDEKSIFLKCSKMGDSSSFECFQGELNMSSHREYFTHDSNKPMVIKGAQIQRYFITNELSQGDLEYVLKKKYLKEKSRSKKSLHHKKRRIVTQGITGVDDRRRIIGSILSPGVFCAHSCNYLLPVGDADLNYILGILNSKLINWMFKKTSTNSNVNNYELESLPFPKFTQKNSSCQKLSRLVKEVLEKQDSSKAEAEIDAAVYEIFGLTQSEIAVVESSYR